MNALYKQKHVMCRAMRKPLYLPFNRFYARLTELNIYLPLFLVSSESKKTPPEELNKILLYAVPNVWENQS